MEDLVSPPFSDDDFEQLDAWLHRRHSGILDVVTLEGFLTAILIGPNTISPMLWLPKVWGKGKPQFKDLEELNHFTALVIGLYNEIAVCFEQDPESFEPSFYERRFDDQTVVVVDEWCEGFIKGMRVDTEGWKPLQRERPDVHCAGKYQRDQIDSDIERFGANEGHRAEGRIVADGDVRCLQIAAHSR